jgi:hypothetical protein
MLTSLTRLDDYAVAGLDDGGHLGRVRDPYFDDRRWSIRRLVVETGHWPGHHRVLVSPWSVRGLPDEGAVRIRTTIRTGSRAGGSRTGCPIRGGSPP